MIHSRVLFIGLILGSLLTGSNGMAETSSNQGIIGFWTPRVANRLQIAKEFWSPRTKYIFDYWNPKVKNTVDMTSDYWVPEINNEVLPAVQKWYSKIDERYGEAVGKEYLFVMSFWRPLFNDRYDYTTGYWAQHIPTFLKIKFSELFTALVEYVTRKDYSGLIKSESNKDAYEFLRSAVLPSKDEKLQARVQSDFEKLLPSMRDQKLRGCQRVVVLESEWANSLQTGCTVYITEGLAKILTDDEIIGVLSHELTHEDEGHLVRAYSQLAVESGKQFIELISEDVAWLLTGDVGEVLDAAVKETQMDRLVRIFSHQTIEQEELADQGGAQMLCRAGFNPLVLKSALIKLSRALGYAEDESLGGERSRYYPSLKRRTQIIEQVAQSCNQGVITK